LERSGLHDEKFYLIVAKGRIINALEVGMYGFGSMAAANCKELKLRGLL
jgi:hypothetical protein